MVIGGGAAGLSAALFAARAGAAVTMIDKNEKFGKKLYITGKGRCNLCNACDTEEFLRNVPRNPRFLYSALRFLSPDDLQRLMNELGCATKVERGNRVFPVSDHASDVSRAFLNALRGQALKLQVEALGLVIEEGRVTGVRVCDAQGERVIPCDCAVLATGGVSYPVTGSTGDGYVLAQQAGHTIIPPRPSLVALTSQEAWCAEAQGLSLKNCALTAMNTETGKTVYTDFGEMLFTHFGVSGPMVLSASAHLRNMRSGKYRLLLDVKPALSLEQLDARLVREFEAHKNTCLGNTLAELLPRLLIAPVLSLCGLAGEKKCHSVSREERQLLVQQMKKIPITVSGFRPIEEAIVTAGGVSTREVNAKTMESKLVNGLYFAGEVLDVDAYTGGFNLQIAFSTGFAAGSHIL